MRRTFVSRVGRCGAAGFHHGFYLRRVPGGSARWLSGAASGPQIAVVYGSQSGTAHLFAENLAQGIGELDAFKGAPEPVVMTGNELVSGELEPDVLLILAACYGRGEPTDNFSEFYASAMGDGAYPPRLQETPVAVFGLGSSRTHCDYYNSVGRDLDARFEELGVPRLMDVTFGDDSGDIDEDFEAWQEKVNGVLQGMDFSSAANSGQTAVPAVPQEPAAPTAAPESEESVGNGDMPFHSAGASDYEFARVASVIPQTSDVMSKDMPWRCIFEVSLASPDHAPLDFVTGDYVLIKPENSAARVRSFCDALGWAEETEVEKFAGALVGTTSPSGAASLGNLLRYCFEVDSLVTPQAIALLSKELANAGLEQLASECLKFKSDKALYKGTVVAQRLTLDAFVRLLCGGQEALAAVRSVLGAAGVPSKVLSVGLPRLSDRCYSISSTSRTGHDDGIVQLTFRYVAYHAADGGGPLIEGVASRFMHNLQPQQLVSFKIRHGTFRLCTDPMSPLVMVAGGIGVAPFRAFMLDRRETLAKGEPLGPGLLFYGTRDASDDAYMGLIKDSLDDAVLTHAFVAHSDDPPSDEVTVRPGLTICTAEMVHQCFERHGQQVWDLLTHNPKTRIYVCGGAAGFGEAMVAAVKRLATDYGGHTPEQADAYFRSLIRDNRYLEDLAD